MDVYEHILNEFLNTPRISEWVEIQALFRRVADGKPAHWLLPQRACEAVGGDLSGAVPALVAVACSHMGIVMVDDMLDADPRGEHLKVGEAVVANMACALQSVALASITRCELDEMRKLAALESLNQMFLATALGQHWDVHTREITEEVYWKIAKTKSSPFFGEAFHLGALMGGASVQLAARVRNLGFIYGEMIQIHDDLNDALEVPANPDWTGGRLPLPILFAEMVDHPARGRFEKLRQKAGASPKALKEAQEILIQCGAVSYCIDQLLRRYQAVRKVLSNESLLRPSSLIRLFEDVVAPVWSLFQAAGEKPFED